MNDPGLTYWVNNLGQPQASDGRIKASSLIEEMDRVWAECKRYADAASPSMYLVPAWWFERAPVRRVGRRLLKGRWRPSQRFLDATAWWRGNTPVVMDKPLPERVHHFSAHQDPQAWTPQPGEGYIPDGPHPRWPE